MKNVTFSDPELLAVYRALETMKAAFETAQIESGLDHDNYQEVCSALLRVKDVVFWD